MVADAEIDALYERTLKPRLEALEGLRREVKGYITKAGVIVGIPAAILFFNGLIGLLLPDWLEWLPMAVGVVGLFVAVGVCGFKYLIPGFTAFTNYRVRFKHEVAAEVFKIVCPTAAYAPLEGIAEAVFDEPGIFSTTGTYNSDDRVRGRIGETPFEAADVKRHYSTGGKNSRTVYVFHGLFFHIDFNKRLRGTTLVDPAAAESRAFGDRSGLTTVTIENPVFTEKFTVYSTDEVEARYILTPAMMERVLALQARTSHPVFLGFKNNRAFLGVHYGRALFEPGISESTSVAAIHEMAAHFALAEGIVHELDLNTRIWTKDVDDSLLHAPDEAGPTDALDEAVKQGNLTAEALWAAATKATGGTTDDGADHDVAPPPATSIRLDRSGQGLVVDYGLGVGFVVALVLWAASIPTFLAAARALPVAMDLPQLTRFTSWMPELSFVPAVVGAAPLPFAIGAGIVGPIAFLMWAFRVRKVEIAPDAVRIWRGLRPLPRTYPRPLYGKVVRVENAVYVGKSEGLNLVNPSASPMLAKGEAPWVAACMRQAFKQTAR